MTVEIETELIRERTETFWSRGNEVAIRFGREDLVLNEVERAAQAYVNLLQERMAEMFGEGISIEEIDSLDKRINLVKTNNPFFAAGQRKMSKLVEEVLKS